MTAVKDPRDRSADLGRLPALLREGKLTEHICVLWYAGKTLDSARAALAQDLERCPGRRNRLGDGRLLSAARRYSWTAAAARAQLAPTSPGTRILPSIDNGNFGYPTIDPPVYRQMVRFFHRCRRACGHSCDRRSRHRLGGRHVCAGAWRDPDSSAPAQHHSRQYPERSCHRNHGRCSRRNTTRAYPEVQAPFMWWIGDTYAGNFGPRTALRLVPLQTFLDQGIRWGGGSDYPGDAARSPLRPVGLGRAADIERNFWHASVRHGRIRRHSNSASFLYHRAARQLFLEDRTGSLEIGKEADIAVWDRNIPTGSRPANCAICAAASPS